MAFVLAKHKKALSRVKHIAGIFELVGVPDFQTVYSKLIHTGMHAGPSHDDIHRFSYSIRLCLWVVAGATKGCISLA